MNNLIDPIEKDLNTGAEKQRSPEEVKQEQTDPNLTELKGFTDPDEELEPTGTDNDV